MINQENVHDFSSAEDFYAFNMEFNGKIADLYGEIS